MDCDGSPQPHDVDLNLRRRAVRAMFDEIYAPPFRFSATAPAKDVRRARNRRQPVVGFFGHLFVIRLRGAANRRPPSKTDRNTAGHRARGNELVRPCFVAELSAA